MLESRVVENEARRGRLDEVQPFSFTALLTLSGDCGVSKASWREGEGRMMVSMMAISTQNGRRSVCLEVEKDRSCGNVYRIMMFLFGGSRGASENGRDDEAVEKS